MTRPALVLALTLVARSTLAEAAALGEGHQLRPPVSLAVADGVSDAKARRAWSDLDFDLLAAPSSQPTTASLDDGAIRTRRSMLTVHQGLGMGLTVLELSTVVLGQLNYRDRFGGGDRSGRFSRPHAALAYSTLGLFVTHELIAFLAPVPIKKESQGIDRATLPKVGMMTASAGMLTETVLGIYASRREGFDNRRDLAKAHLSVGYATYLAMALGASAFE